MATQQRPKKSAGGHAHHPPPKKKAKKPGAKKYVHKNVIYGAGKVGPVEKVSLGPSKGVIRLCTW